MSAVWPVEWPASAPEATPEQKALAEQLAISTLRTLTLNRVGGEPITVFPSSSHRWAQGSYYSRFGRYYWVEGNLSAYDLKSIFYPARAVILDGGVADLIAVTVDGVTLLPDQYELINGSHLVRTDGAGWPTGDLGDFSVTYSPGYPVDALGTMIAGLLAVEFLKALIGDRKCALPKNVTSVTRAGVSFEMSTSMWPDNATGITAVDAWVNTWNPNALRTRPQVLTHDWKNNTRKRTF